VLFLKQKDPIAACSGKEHIMNLSFKKEPIKKVGNDIFAFDFLQAEQFGIELYQSDSKPIILRSAAVSADGTLYLNTKHEDFSRLLEIYELFNDTTTEDLIKIYKLYDINYPEIRELEDVDKYRGIARGEAMTKMFLKMELLRREYKTAKVQPLLNLLFHGECD
jgi:hypothetical protein